MQKIAIIVATVLVAGLAVAALKMGASDEAPVVSSAFDADAGIGERLAALELAVSAERDARQLLEEEIFALYDEIETLEQELGTQNQSGQVMITDGDGTRTVVRGDVDAAEMRRMMRASRGTDRDMRRDGLVEAGFSVSKAEWIIEREASLRMEAMQTRYEAMRAGEPINPYYNGIGPDNALRAELGDSQYETYLEASGRSTAINVAAVFESSPARTAGLQSGDRITHYDGERIFSVYDLTSQTMDGAAGENVVVNITRDGIPMQVVLPRGPLGINAGGR